MNSSQEYQTDLEVILEFLEEHYRQESIRKPLWEKTKELCAISTSEVVDTSGEQFSNALDRTDSQLQLSASVAQQVTGSPVEANKYDSYTDYGANCSVTEVHNQSLILHNALNGQNLNALNGPDRPLTQHSTPERSTESCASITPAEKGKKLRLFHFLFEVLEDPGMSHCVSWVPASAGVFRFSARHKERVAELWGQRKGNRMPMTYQKMSRALRNYARSGEIIKVKKKLTYQFSVDTLSTLRSQSGIKNAPCGSK
ncbi:uncharacterized protein spi2 [Xyrauchen texanus]|uniref:uncharacterized protein spi2 n=1 Tax=Xyrauchen texanus TaxID=154827 RepID=UPI002241AC02|nr:uncharacterized protein spi2 [Xyrauchen texanus]